MTNEADNAMDSMDFARIQDTSDGDTEFEQELFEAYLEDCADRIGRLRNARAASDTDALRREAHTVKGASANVGTTQLQAIAQILEQTATDLDGAAIDELIAKIEAEFARVKEAIQGYLATL